MKCRTIKKSEIPVLKNSGRVVSNATLLKVLEFVNTNDEAIEFEYDNEKELMNAYSLLGRYNKNQKFGDTKISVCRRQGKLYVSKGVIVND